MKLRTTEVIAPPAPAPVNDAFESERNAETSERSRLMSQILELNPTASSDFLSRFPVKELGAYLQHLLVANQPRGRMARWIRPDNVPGIAWSEPQA
jgi:hypothetical protein